MIISFTTCFCEANVCFVEIRGKIISRREVCSTIESDGCCGTCPLSNNIVTSVNKTGVDSTEMERTISTERGDRFRHVHCHINGWLICVIAGHINFVVP